VHLAAEYGLLRPVVGIVRMDPFPDSGNDVPCRIRKVRGWAGDQDWHRGEFLLFVETDENDYLRRCGDLLAPAPATWSRAEPPKPRSAKAVLHDAMEAASASEDPNPGDTAENQDPLELLRRLQKAVDTDAASATPNPLVQGLCEWLNEKLRPLALSIDEPDTSAGESGEKQDVEHAPIALPGTIVRVKTLRVMNFRGFASQDGKAFELDLDADLVLLSGPNGLGKTSLIEALDLLLTGHHQFPRDPHCLFHGNATDFRLEAEVRFAPDDGNATAHEQTGTVACRGRRRKERDGKWTVSPFEWSVNSERGSTIVRPLTREFQERFGEDELTSRTARQTAELLSRRTVVYPDRLDELFDETTHGVTLRDYLDPLPPWVAEFLQTVNSERHDSVRSQLDTLMKRTAEERSMPDPEGPRKKVEAALDALRPLYGDELATVGEWPPFPPSGDEEDLSGFVEALSARRGESAASDELPDVLHRVLDALRREEIRRSEATASDDAGREMVEDIERKLEQCNAELAVIDSKYPQLDQEATAFDAGEQPDLLAILETLRDHAARWAGAKQRQQDAQALRMVLAELRRVRSEDAAKCAQELGVYLYPRRQALADRSRLREDRDRLLVERRRAVGSERAARLVAMRGRLEDVATAVGRAWQDQRDVRERTLRAERAQDRLDSLHSLDAILRKAVGSIETAVRVSEPIRKEVQTLANSILSRVAPAGGPLRVKVEAGNDESSSAERRGARRRFVIKTEDGRDQVVLSFGQRTQVGVAMAIAENRMLETQLGHRVFLMDDLSATYDLANLSRDAVFWRQMAYGSGVPVESVSRQVFLSSHHEDLSNRLLDVMPPVAGRRMLLYRFRAWKKGTGPDFEVYDVEPQPSLHEGSERQDFREWLQVQITETVDADA